MTFDVTPNVHIRRDDDDRVRQIRHPQEPYAAAAAVPTTPRLLAQSYLEDVASLLDYGSEVLTTLGESVADTTQSSEGSRLRFRQEKSVANTRIEAYTQTHLGIVVFRAAASVVLEADPLRVTSVANEFRYGIDVEPLGDNARFAPDQTTEIRDLLSRLLGSDDASEVELNHTGLVLYQYDPDNVLDAEFDVDDATDGDQAGATDGGAASARRAIASVRPSTTALREAEPGRWYICTEATFTAAVGPWPELSFRVIIDATSGLVLYVQPGVSGVDGMVFRYDPQSQANDATITPCSPAGTLDPWSETVVLQGLTVPTAGADQELTGARVTLGEQAAPVVNPPTEPVGTDFNYSAVTDDFAAVNAYWHIDEMLRFIDGLPNLSVAGYFNNTTFPVTVDHRDASLGTVNARAYANAGMNGSGGFGFNLAQSGCPVGIAADSRIAWHEVCHALLLENVSSFNFGFAHSAGDALGVILSDWVAPSVDRFETFPFNSINRRHDRGVTGGWAWGGTFDVGSYSSESILATTLFRLYRSIGGDSPYIQQRQLAAEHAAYLTIGAIGTLTPATNPADPDGFATALMDFDKANDYSGISRGALHKVVRWAFEQQGLYQPPGAPTPVVSAGAPPAVDVYIDDGRPGTYEFLHSFWNSTDIWNRLASDGGTAHETPVTGQTNYMYVKVRNRGTAMATGVSVSGYNCIPGTGLVWPNDWSAMTTATVAGADIPPGGDVTVGPFEWTPTNVGHECLLAIASATEDPANDTTVIGSIPHNRFVPFDNNIGQRNVAPVPGGGGAQALTAAFVDRRFVFRNPLDRTITGLLEARLPDFLTERQWSLRFLSPGGHRFTLGPLGSREIVMALEPGGEIAEADVPSDPAERAIEVLAFGDGVLVGGMTYDVDPRLTEPPREGPERHGGCGGCRPGISRRCCPDGWDQRRCRCLVKLLAAAVGAVCVAICLRGRRRRRLRAL